MNTLQRKDLWSLEQYAEQRADFRKKMIQHKKSRQLALGDHLRLYFEDELTVRYQIQEMLRIEKTFEASGIQEELDAYNPLIPDGHNWKATCMIEFDDPTLRKEQLALLIGIEDAIWLQIDDHPPIHAIADEDLERENDSKTSAVHFLRFELTPEMRAAAKAGAVIRAGVDHPQYYVKGFAIAEPIRQSLVADLSS